jgi:transposase
MNSVDGVFTHDPKSPFRLKRKLQTLLRKRRSKQKRQIKRQKKRQKKRGGSEAEAAIQSEGKEKERE